MATYADTYNRSIENQEEFWLEQAQAISWSTEPTRALDSDAAPLYRWFPDGTLNTCYNAVDRHVEAGHGDRTAITYDSAMLGTRQNITYSELKDEVEKIAGALASAGVEKGDRVLIYMPMIPQAAMAMLAVARLGAVHSVVFGGFAPNELASRINDCSAPRRAEMMGPRLREAIATEALSMMRLMTISSTSGSTSTGSVATWASL